jgi:hypothetical protein
MTVETRSPSQAEWAAALPMEANVAGVLGDLGTSANRKIWMNFYHVYAVLQLSEVDFRTGNRGTSCLGLIVCCCTHVLWEFLVVSVGVFSGHCMFGMCLVINQGTRSLATAAPITRCCAATTRSTSPRGTTTATSS